MYCTMILQSVVVLYSTCIVQFCLMYVF